MLDIVLPALLFITPFQDIDNAIGAGVSTVRADVQIEMPAATYQLKDTLPVFSAISLVLAEEQSGKVVYDYQSHVQREIASLTKIMTVIVALEHYDEEELIFISDEAASTPGSSLRLLAGDMITVRELAYGALIKSGNDAAVALAEHAPRGAQQFYGWMNDKAKALGMYQTHFENPIGFDDALQYSTAEDMLKLTRYARATHPLMVDAASYPTYTVKGMMKSYEAASTNAILGQGVDGFKTGTTDLAGQSFIASFPMNGRRYLLIILGSEDRFGDALRVMEWLRVVMFPSKGG